LENYPAELVEFNHGGQGGGTEGHGDFLEEFPSEERTECVPINPFQSLFKTKGISELF
jgi:hypothetical protein